MESKDVLGSFWHLVNLPFHEAGHILFRPFGRLMTSLGGSITQLLMPLICLAGGIMSLIGGGPSVGMALVGVLLPLVLIVGGILAIGRRIV